MKSCRRKIGDLLSNGSIVAIQDGNHGGSHPKSSQFTESGIPFVMGKDVTQNRVDLENCNFLPKDLADSLRIGFAHSGDVLLTHKGTVGHVAVVPPVKDYVMLTPQVTYYRVNPEEIYNRYLQYAFLEPQFQHELGSYSAQSTRPYVSISAQKNLSLALPDLPTQRKIAGILSAYDDLIENNLRRIRILEEMAQSLYREWFVHFRFPGHESTPLVDSPLGPIPEGWEVKKLQDVTSKIGSGATPKGGKDAYKSEGISLIRSLNIFDYEFKHDNLAFIDEDQAAKLSNVVVEPYDVLLNITGASVARCSMVPSAILPARVNQHVAIIRADQESDPFYILDTINSDERKRQILAMAQGGATREALTKTTISNLEIMVPSPPTLQRFAKIRRDLFEERQTLAQKNQVLRQTRDLLLPKLLSGGSNS